MSDLRATAVTRAVALLTAAGAEFKVIYGTVEYGTLKVAPPEPERKPKRNNPKYSHGERTKYIRGHIKDMKVGDLVTIPYGTYPAADIGYVVPPTAMDMWGKGSYQTQMHDTGIDILRIL